MLPAERVQVLESDGEKAHGGTHRRLPARWKWQIARRLIDRIFGPERTALQCSIRCLTRRRMVVARSTFFTAQSPQIFRRRSSSRTRFSDPSAGRGDFENSLPNGRQSCQAFDLAKYSMFAVSVLCFERRLRRDGDRRADCERASRGWSAGRVARRCGWCAGGR
jgi:hypothetical protein